MGISPENNLESKLNNTASLLIKGFNFEVPVLLRYEIITGLPRNFSQEIPGKLWRGSWPVEQLGGLKTLNINRIVSLYNPRDVKEQALLPILRSAVALTGLEHIVVDVEKNIDLLNAAISYYDPHLLTYVHCQAGANRTGLFCLVANILELQNSQQIINRDIFVKILTQLLRSGFDFDQEKYVLYLNEIIERCLEMGLLSIDLFR